jgi:hypothetical protein
MHTTSQACLPCFWRTWRAAPDLTQQLMHIRGRLSATTHQMRCNCLRKPIFTAWGALAGARTVRTTCLFLAAGVGVHLFTAGRTASKKEDSRQLLLLYSGPSSKKKKDRASSFHLSDDDGAMKVIRLFDPGGPTHMCVLSVQSPSQSRASWRSVPVLALQRGGSSRRHLKSQNPRLLGCYRLPVVSLVSPCVSPRVVAARRPAHEKDGAKHR